MYKLDMAGHETVLHSFLGGSDGATPLAGVVVDSAGNLYGTTRAGGAASVGVVYKLDTAGNETVLHSFSGGSDGGLPAASQALDSAGNLVGTAKSGGRVPGGGVVFKLDPTGHETVLHNFTGARPRADLSSIRRATFLELWRLAGRRIWVSCSSSNCGSGD